jgi:hypothetical protein
MYFLKSQIPEYRALTKQQKRTVKSVYRRKSYSRFHRILPLDYALILIVIWGSKFLGDKYEVSSTLTIMTVFSLMLIYKGVIAIWHTNQLAKSRDFIEKFKDFEWGF